MIDIALLPTKAMVDTNVFMRGVLGDRPEEPSSVLCVEFCNAMLDKKLRIFVAAPTLAEVIRHQGKRVPRTQGIVVVPFDDRAAELLGMTLSMGKLHVSKAASGASLTYLKYDSMIMACALRSGVPVFVTMDSDHHPLAKDTSIRVEHPSAFRAPQRTIFDLLSAGAAKEQGGG